ncbi:MAG TPA: helix-turn-helix domain-containing protein [Rhizomicrobium sp.]|nr:helix-turn-helix domain-containing protein [Rhizomicrobium sp.]
MIASSARRPLRQPLAYRSKERQRSGIEKAKAAGVYKGRPVTLDHAKVVQMDREGVGATEIARALKCSRSAVYKVLNAA